MVFYCPWCGAPIPDKLSSEFESYYSIHTKEIVCVRCQAKTLFWSGCDMGDKLIAKILDDEEEI